MALNEQIPLALKKTNFSGLGEKKQGKVRDNYWSNDKIVMIATDRVSAFDVVLGTIPFKGELLTTLSAWWFDQMKDIIENHVVSVPDPSVLVVKRCKPLPVEIVVRGYLTGSLWRSYKEGDRAMYGLEFKEGLKMNQAFDKPIITPTTKAEEGHDLPLKREEIVGKLVPDAVYTQAEKAALALFARGQEIAKKRGLLLVDTKYEFGMFNDKLILIDEVHTPDSSRFWYAESYDTAFQGDEQPKAMSKEFLREWLIDRGFMGEGTPPDLPDELKIMAAERYREVVETFVGEKVNLVPGDVKERIGKNLRDAGWNL